MASEYGESKENWNCVFYNNTAEDKPKHEHNLGKKDIISKKQD